MLLAGLLLGACTAGGQTSRTPGATVTQAAAPAAPVASTSTTPPAASQPAATQSAAGQTTTAAPDPDDNPARLVGLDRDRLVRLMGPAPWVRQEVQAEVWQYRRSDCVLNLYLYDRVGLRQVVHYDMMDGAGQLLQGDRARRACLRGLRGTG